jgi:hypothetical protein
VCGLQSLEQGHDEEQIPCAPDSRLFDQLHKTAYFSKLDIQLGSWQVRITERDEPKTTCITRYGSFQFMVMPFGLTNVPATFYNLINDVLHDYIDKFVVVYLDDIVVYSKSFDDHLYDLKLVLYRLRENSLFVEKEKTTLLAKIFCSLVT